MEHADAQQNCLVSVKNTFAKQASNQQPSPVGARDVRKKIKRKEARTGRLSTTSLLPGKLNFLRETLLGQGHLSELPLELAGERMPDGFFDVFQPEVLSRDPDDSIQYALASVFRKKSAVEIDVKYQEARRSAIEILFDCSIHAYFEKSCLEDGSLDAAHLRSLILLDPRNISENPSVSEYLAGEMERDRARFLKTLAKDCYNADRRRQHVPVDVCSYVLARHWTDKHCPLWLMGRQALLSACKSLAPDEFWTEAVVKERLRKHRLCGFRPAPIVAVQIGKDKQIAAFEIESTIYRQLCLTKFGHQFVTPLSDRPKNVHSGDFQSELDAKAMCSAPHLTERKSAACEGAPRGYVEIRDRVHSVLRRADNIVNFIAKRNISKSDPCLERAWNVVATLNGLAAFLGESANRLKFRAGWVEPHLFPRYQAREAKRRPAG